MSSSEQVINISNNQIPPFQVVEEEQQQNTTQPTPQNDVLQQQDSDNVMEQEQEDEDLDIEEIQAKENLLLQIDLYLQDYGDKLQSFAGRDYSSYSIDKLKRICELMDYKIGIMHGSKQMLHGLYYTGTSIAESNIPSLSGLTSNLQQSEGVQSALNRVAIKYAKNLYMSPLMALLVATGQVAAITMYQNKMNQVQQEQNDVEIKLKSQIPDNLKAEIDAKMAEMKQEKE